MVTVIGYEQRMSEEGKEFFTLTIQGGVEVIESQNGNLYLTARKTNIPSTFDENECEMLVGTKIPGEIRKSPCKPYDYVNKRTGETITLSYTYEFVEEKKKLDSVEFFKNINSLEHNFHNENAPINMIE